MSSLIPVAQWIWALYRVTYHETQGGPAKVTDYIVTASDLRGQIEERWPGPWATWYEYELIENGVAEPRSIGQLYGHSISESGWSAGQREAKTRGLI